MMEFNTFSEIEKALKPYIPLASEITGKDITLKRMIPLMAAIGNPEKKLSIIHIAGTSGKTSTTYYIAALLSATGKKVGMTVSPHVDSIGERLQINMQLISAEDFGRALGEFLTIITAAQLQPTYFELLIAFVYWYFAKVGVDYAVIETGLGGLHDSTNMATEPSKICVITDIGYDHMHVLGNTISEIAAQKAGIIHHGNHVYMYKQSVEVMAAMLKRSVSQKAQVHIVEQSYLSEPKSVVNLPAYQQRNWHLAHSVYDAVKVRDSLEELLDVQLEHAMEIQVPGRMDQKQVGNKLVIMDGAHNGQKVHAFVSSFKARFPGQKAAILLSLKTSKDYTEVLPLLHSITTTLIITSFSGMQDRFVENIAPKKLAKAAETYGFVNIITESDQDAAYNMLLNQPDGLLVVTGSFYLIGQLRSNHKELM